jgi:ribosomal protein S18 acetylase RimI-like enzyme
MPDDYPPDLRARLAAQGFVAEGEEPGMAIDLDQLGAAPETPKGVAIEEIKDVEGLAQHIHLMTIGFDMPPHLETAFGGLLQGMPIGPGTSVRCFLAREHGQPVGTSLVSLSGGAAAIFNVVTVPEARGRGMGTLVTDAALRAAREAGHRIVVLESSRIGYNVYRRLGFEEYCKIGHYVWSGEADT